MNWSGQHLHAKCTPTVSFWLFSQSTTALEREKKRERGWWIRNLLSKGNASQKVSFPFPWKKRSKGAEEVTYWLDTFLKVNSSPLLSPRERWRQNGNGTVTHSLKTTKMSSCPLLRLALSLWEGIQTKWRHNRSTSRMKGLRHQGKDRKVGGMETRDWGILQSGGIPVRCKLQ
jgi:hypothetical protein